MPRHRLALTGLLLALLALVSSCAAVLADINGSQARQLVQEGALLLDVRSTREFREGHLDGAVNIPYEDLEARGDELGPRDRPVVLYCKSGVRAHWAKSTLHDLGFTDVQNLGSPDRW